MWHQSARRDAFTTVQRDLYIGLVFAKGLILLAHDCVDELVLVEHTIAILISPVHHLLKLVIGHVLAKLLAHTLKVLEGYGAGLVVIEQLENLDKVLTGVLTLKMNEFKTKSRMRHVSPDECVGVTQTTQRRHARRHVLH